MNSDILYLSGLQTSTSSFLRKDSQLEHAVNVHFEQIGSVTGRLGYSQVGDTLAGVNSPQGGLSYNIQSTGVQNLFVLVNGSLVYWNGSSWNTVIAGLSSTAKAEFRVFVDQLYMVGANSSNVYLTPANVSGVTYSTSSNLSGAPEGARFIELYQNKIYMADVKVSGTRYPSRWYRSSVPDDGVITWTSTDFEEVYTDNGEPLKGMHTNKTLNQLLFFKENSLHAWNNFNLRDVGNVGTTAHRSIVTINYTTFFFNDKGIYAYSGTEPKLISRPIQKWIDGIDQTATGDVFAIGLDNRFYKLYVGSITVDGVTYTNCEIVYSILDNAFTIYSYYNTFSFYALHKESGKIRVYAGATDGNVYKLAARNDTVYADNSNPISGRFTLKALDMGLPGDKKYIDRVIIYTTRPQNLQGRMRARGKDWSTWFPINDTEHEVSVNPDNGRFLQFDFSFSSVEAPVIMEGLSFNVVKSSNNYA